MTAQASFHFMKLEIGRAGIEVHHQVTGRDLRPPVRSTEDLAHPALQEMPPHRLSEPARDSDTEAQLAAVLPVLRRAGEEEDRGVAVTDPATLAIAARERRRRAESLGAPQPLLADTRRAGVLRLTPRDACGPCDDGGRARRARAGSSCARESRASSCGAGCSAGMSFSRSHLLFAGSALTAVAAGATCWTTAWLDAARLRSRGRRMLRIDGGSFSDGSST